MSPPKLSPGLAARTIFLMSTHFVPRADKSTYSSHAAAAVNTLQTWYDESTGLWSTTGWWDSANCLTILGDYAVAEPSESNTLGVASIMSNTFTAAQNSGNALVVNKIVTPNGLVSSTYTPSSLRRRATSGFEGFLNDYYDDEGWWALAWLRAYDVTHRAEYLEMAQRIFFDMQGGVDGVCGGGIWWNKDRKYKNAITNELYLSVAAGLANRVSSNGTAYRNVARMQWEWFRRSGLINERGQVNDGLVIDGDGTCVNNGQTVWSYNQGVVLGGLAELYKATGNDSYLNEALKIAQAAVALLSDDGGVIHESCEPGKCGGDGSQFKGIFMRNLQYLQRVFPQDAFRTVILKNADAIWEKARNESSGRIGLVWSGPPNAGGAANASTHSSALDTLVASTVVF